MTPKSFLCKGDSNISAFELIDTDLANTGVQLVDCWDFGPKPQEHCSYSYHMPLGALGLTSASDPGMAMAGDPNPWLNSPGFEKRKDTHWSDFDPSGDKQRVKLGNAWTHQEDGQNIVYVDGHVQFEKTSACSTDGDNAFTKLDPASKEKRKGLRPNLGDVPEDRTDSLLLTDGNVYPN